MVVRSDKKITILDLIKSRKDDNSVFGERKDAYKLGLVVEGGGMRGTVCAGSVALMEELDIRNVFDAYYAVSAGTPATVCYLTGQAKTGIAFYYNNLARGNLVKLTEIFRGKPVLKLGSLIEQITSQAMIDYEQIIGKHSQVNFFATHAQTGAVTRMDVSSPEKILQAMYYSCFVPLAAGLPDENQLLDGGLSTTGIPIQQALEDGCTHVLCLLTRPIGKGRKLTMTDRFTSMALRIKKYPIAAQQCLSLSSSYNKTVEYIIRNSNFGMDSSPIIEFIAPSSSDREVKPHEQNPHKLYQGAVSGFVSARNYFGQHHISEEIIPGIVKFN